MNLVVDSPVEKDCGAVPLGIVTFGAIQNHAPTVDLATAFG